MNIKSLSLIIKEFFLKIYLIGKELTYQLFNFTVE